MTTTEANEKLKEILNGVLQILYVVKGEWGESWSEWDESIYQGVVEIQKNLLEGK